MDVIKSLRKSGYASDLVPSKEASWIRDIESYFESVKD